MVKFVPLVLRSYRTDYIERFTRFDAMWADKGGYSVHAMKDIEVHAQRRKYWERTMSGMPSMLPSPLSSPRSDGTVVPGSAMKNYMIFLKDCMDRLCHRLQQDYKNKSVQDLRRVMGKPLPSL